uniref:DNA-directed RNA polymerase subunit n=1 Tax=Oryza punctata TaxID=4537 RepID=A0A0E0L8D4_ORYPU
MFRTHCDRGRSISAVEAIQTVAQLPLAESQSSPPLAAAAAAPPNTRARRIWGLSLLPRRGGRRLLRGLRLLLLPRPHRTTTRSWLLRVLLASCLAAAAADAMDALREAEAKLTVYVHPSNAADVGRAIVRQLSSLLFSYEDRFDGVLLAHEATVESEQGKILNGLVPYFGVPVHANLLLYSPKPDMMLEGKVEMLGKESIHAIVLGVFSAAIMSDDIHEKFKFKRKKYGGKFVSRLDKQHVIKKGSMIRFSVKRVDAEMNCHVTGSLIPPHTGSMLWLSVHDAEYVLEINSGKRSRDIKIKTEQHEQDHSVKNSERQHKSKSRKRSFEER